VRDSFRAVVEPHRVVVVVDPTYGTALRQLIPDRPVWIVKSEANDPIIQRVWAENESESNVTAFNATDTPEETFVSILGVVEEHHGVYSHDPALTDLEVIGTAATDAVRRALEAYGFDRIVATPDGFHATRDEPTED
jgi:hypothetical protein